jgi:hypothetical protein
MYSTLRYFSYGRLRLCTGRVNESANLFNSVGLFFPCPANLAAGGDE